MTNFDDYINNLRAEADRGSAPNHTIPIKKFIGVADNIKGRIAEIKPVASMCIYVRTFHTFRSIDSKKELYDLSQQFMLMTRYVSLFTKVIWAHPDASCNPDVHRCRQQAIEYLGSTPVLRERMQSVWSGSQNSSGPPSRDEPYSVPDNPKPHGSSPIFPSTHIHNSKYPSLRDDPLMIRTPPGETAVSSYPCLADSSSSQDQPPAKRQMSVFDGVTIPFDLAGTFHELAKRNTSKGIETCGILLGYQQFNSSILVTTVVVPEQTGTRDTCETLPGAEEKILAYALTNELVCLGWIHTHPTQSCFLSSVDMHTTLPYQQMLADAIAIVLAPNDKDLPVGVWRLTPSGMDGIKGCNLRGFHDHEGKGAFSKLVKDIHWDTAVNVVVVDHRRLDKPFK